MNCLGHTVYQLAKQKTQCRPKIELIFSKTLIYSFWWMIWLPAQPLKIETWALESTTPLLFVQLTTKSYGFFLLYVSPLHSYYVSSSLGWIITAASFSPSYCLLSFLSPIRHSTPQELAFLTSNPLIPAYNLQWLPTAYRLSPDSFPQTFYKLSFQPDAPL